MVLGWKVKACGGFFVEIDLDQNGCVVADNPGIMAGFDANDGRRFEVEAAKSPYSPRMWPRPETPRGRACTVRRGAPASNGSTSDSPEGRLPASPVRSPLASHRLRPRRPRCGPRRRSGLRMDLCACHSWRDPYPSGAWCRLRRQLSGRRARPRHLSARLLVVYLSLLGKHARRVDHRHGPGGPGAGLNDPDRRAGSRVLGKIAGRAPAPGGGLRHRAPVDQLSRRAMRRRKGPEQRLRSVRVAHMSSAVPFCSNRELDQRRPRLCPTQTKTLVER